VHLQRLLWDDIIPTATNGSNVMIPSQFCQKLSQTLQKLLLSFEDQKKKPFCDMGNMFGKKSLASIEKWRS
jgi:hypothetical protein